MKGAAIQVNISSVGRGADPVDLQTELLKQARGNFRRGAVRTVNDQSKWERSADCASKVVGIQSVQAVVDREHLRNRFLSRLDPLRHELLQLSFDLIR